MNLAEIRKTYPQYDDVSDDQLIDALHAKYYSDIPRNEFASIVNPPKDRGLIGHTKDTAIDLAKGVVGFGESVVGIGDILTGGALGKGLQSLGYEPKQTQEFLSSFQSDARKKAESNVQNADGFIDTAIALGTNPSVLVGNIVQSLPGTVGAGAVGGLFVKNLASKALAEAGTLGLTGDAASNFVANKVKEQTIKIASVAASAEGAQAAGSIAEAGRQSGSDWNTYVAPALAAGLGTTAIGIVSGKIATKLGIGDAETEIAARSAGISGVGGGAQSFAKRVPAEMFKEGVLEEMPQSAQEQAFQNIATNRPIDEGIGSAAAQGLMAGAGMGGGHAAISRSTPSTSPVSTESNIQEAEPLRLTNNPEPLISFPDGTVGTKTDAESYINALPEDKRIEARASLLGLSPQPLTAEDVALGNLHVYSKLSTPRSLDEAGEFANRLAETRGLSYTVIPHAKGGYTIAPTAKLSDEIVARLEPLQPSSIESIARANSIDEIISRFESVVKSTSFNVDSAVERIAQSAGININPETVQQPIITQDSPPIQDQLAVVDTRTADQRQADAYREAIRKSVTGETMTPAEIALSKMTAPEGAIPKIALPNELGVNVEKNNSIELPIRYDSSRSVESIAQRPPVTKTGGEANTQPIDGEQGNPTAPLSNTGKAVSDSNVGVVKEPALNKSEDISGNSINREWTAFSKDSGSLGIPRADMPQIKAEHRGAMVNFLNARGISHEQGEVNPRDLKPTQLEYAPEKVEKAKKYTGTDRSILISSDNHVLDGHHQWLAKRSSGEPVKVIRLDAPIKKLLNDVSEFPSAKNSDGATQKINDESSVEKHDKRKIIPSTSRQDRLLEEKIPEKSGDLSQEASPLSKFSDSNKTKDFGNASGNSQSSQPSQSSESYNPPVSSNDAPIAAASQTIPKTDGKKEDIAAKAEAILDAANIKGKERLDTLKDVKSGALTVDEVARAHQPAKEDEKPRLSTAPIEKTSQQKDAKTGISANEAQKAIAPLRSKWVGFTKISVVQTIDDLPKNILDSVATDSKTEGFYDPKTHSVYLISENISTPERAVWVAIHEVIGHGGLRMLNDKDINKYVKFAAGNRFVAQLSDAIQQERGNIAKNVAIEEAIAELSAAIETGDFSSINGRYAIEIPTSALNGIKGIVSRVIDLIKRFFSAVTGRTLNSVSDSEIRALIRNMRNAVLSPSLSVSGTYESVDDPILFSEKQRSLPPQSESDKPARLSLSAISEKVDQLIEPFKTSVPIRILDATEDMWAGEHVSGAKGVTFNGRIHLFRSGLTDINDVTRTLWHELLHFGLRRFLTKEQYISQMQKLYLTDGWIRNRAIEWINGDEGKKLALQEGITKPYLIARGVDEALAALAETLQTEETGFKDNSLSAKTYRTVREWVAKMADFFGFHDAAVQWRAYAAQSEARELIISTFGKLRDGIAPETTTTKWAYSDPAFSKSTVGGAYEMLKNANSLADATDGLKSALSSVSKMNLWDRTIGTQFNKSKKDADFKRVFDAYNQQTDDTAHYAIEAEKEAPTILQRLDSFRDFGKALFNSGSKQKADLDAISVPLFANIEGKKGIQQKVFSEDELRNEFGLSEHQIGMYRQVRSSVDKSIDRLAQTYISAMAQAAGMDISKLKNLSLSETVKAVKESTENKGIGKNIGGLTENEGLHDRADEIVKQASTLKESGYMPAMRFGEYAVTVTDPKSPDTPIHFEMFESQTAANIKARQLEREYPGMLVDRSVMNPDQYAMFKGVSPETVELFAKFSGQDETEAYKEYIALAKSGRSTMKRLLERKGVAGFSDDISRVLASFITSNARQSAMNMNMADINSALSSKSLARKGDVQREAQKLHEYMSNPKEEAQVLRGFMFMHFLGGSVASAAVNLTQPVLQTAPYLSQYAGAKTPKIMAASAKMAIDRDIQNDELREAFARAEADGITEPHEIHHLMADASGSGIGTSLRARALTKAWGSFFSLSEAFNRRLTFLAAYQTAQSMGQKELEANGFKDAYQFASNAIIETQGLYSKTNRPNWARGAVGATLFTFKQFSISYVEFLNRLPLKQKMLALGILIIASGLQGLPFAGDVEDIIDTIGQSLGYNTNSKKALHSALVEKFGKDLGEVLAYGLSTQSNVDLQGRLGMGNLIPATGLLKMSEKDKGKDLAEIAGPLGAILTTFQKSFSKAQEGDIMGRSGALASLAPVSLKNILQGIDMADTGMYRDSKGRKVQDVDLIDSVIKSLGFQPSKIASESRIMSDIMQDSGMLKAVEESIASRWAQGIAEKDYKIVMRARSALKSWNENNPESKISISQSQIARRVQQDKMSREQRFIKSTPKELRADAMKELRQ